MSETHALSQGAEGPVLCRIELSFFEPVGSMKVGLRGVESAWVHSTDCGEMFGHTGAHETLVDFFIFHPQLGLPS